MTTATGMKDYYIGKIDELEHRIQEKRQNLKRLEAQRNELNNSGCCCLHFSKALIFEFIVRQLREELIALQESGSYVGEVIKQMGKNKVLVKVAALLLLIYRNKFLSFRSTQKENTSVLSTSPLKSRNAHQTLESPSRARAMSSIKSCQPRWIPSCLS